MKVFFVIAVLVSLLFFYSFKIIYSIKMNNFDFSIKVIIKTPFVVKEVYNNKKRKGKKQGKAQEDKSEPKNKISLETLKELKSPMFDAVTSLFRILKRHCKILNVDIYCKVALEDPMENGIAFGAICGTLNIANVFLKETCGVRDSKLNVLSDFESGEGLIFESSGILRIRPIIFLFAIKQIKKIF